MFATDKPKRKQAPRRLKYARMLILATAVLLGVFVVFLLLISSGGAPDLFYLSAAGNQGTMNLYGMDTDCTNAKPEQLTDYQDGFGIYSYGIHDNQVFYTVQRSLHNTELMLLDLDTRQTELLYVCEDAICTGIEMNPTQPEFFFSENANSGSSKTWFVSLVDGDFQQSEFELSEGLWLNQWVTANLFLVTSRTHGAQLFQRDTGELLDINERIAGGKIAPDGVTYVYQDEHHASDPAERSTTYTMGRIDNDDMTTVQGGATSSHDTVLQWHPASSGFTYYHYRRSENYERDLGSELWFYDVANAESALFFASNDLLSEVAWRGDGSQLATTAYTANYPPNAEQQIWLYDMAEQTNRPLYVTGSWLQWRD